MATPKTLRTCEKGRKFYKSSDCPTCSVCETEKESAKGFLALLSTPARNALPHHGIDTIEKLATYTEKEILSIHGIGKASLPTFKNSLAEHDYHLKKYLLKN